MGMSRVSRDNYNTKRRLKREAQRTGRVIVAMPPSDDLTAEQIIERKLADFKRKKAHEEGRTLIDVHIPVHGPFGILFFGDPHLDDDGTDMEALIRDIGLVKRTPGLYAASVGDMTNNWVGRLAHLYGKQSTTARQAWTLTDWFVKELGSKLIYLLGGNHCAWSGPGDPLRWIANQAETVYEMDEMRVALNTPNGREIIVNARHKFNGNSMWNPAHAVMREGQKGKRDDLIVAGHIHSSGMGLIKDPASSRIVNCLQVGTYKVFDSYGREQGLQNQLISPSAVVVFDPDATEPRRLVTMFMDSEEGVLHLEAKRRRAA